MSLPSQAVRACAHCASPLVSVFRRFVAGVLLATAVSCSSGCGLTQPTYMDISPAQLDQIASRLGSDVGTLYTEGRELLKTELSQELGLKVDAIHVPTPEEIREVLDLPEGEPLTTAQIVTAMREEGVIVEIEPASTAALGEVAKEGMKNPVSKENWVAGGIGGAGILIAGALGLRGRRKRKREGVTTPPQNEGAVA